MRKITDNLAALDPEWIFDFDAPAGPRKIGVAFDCPVDDGDGPHREGHRVAVLFKNPPDGGLAHPPDDTMLGDNDGKRWALADPSTALETLTLWPSVDCTRSDVACWHGFVTRGKVTG